MNTSKTQLLRIGQVARQSGVGVETVRFYEKEGLLPRPSRKSSGYRQYAASTVRRIAFIQTGKSLGFALKEIRELMNLRVENRQTCAEVRVRAQDKLSAVDRKMAELQRVRDALRALIDSCRGRGPTGECPLLETLSMSGESHAQG